MNLRDTIERTVWTFVAAALAALPSAAMLDVAAWKAAAVAGIAAVVNFVLLLARYRLSILPNPGEGLPGLPVK